MAAEDGHAGYDRENTSESHREKWFGWTSNSCANSIRVSSPLIAATATFALNAGLWFRRCRPAMVFSSLAASCRCCAENLLIPAVQISAATSAEPVLPKPDSLVADVNAALMEQVFDVPKRKREAHVAHHRQSDDLRAGSEISKWAAVCHPARLCNRPARLRLVFCDKTMRPHRGGGACCHTIIDRPSDYRRQCC